MRKFFQLQNVEHALMIVGLDVKFASVKQDKRLGVPHRNFIYPKPIIQSASLDFNLVSGNDPLLNLIWITISDFF